MWSSTPQILMGTAQSYNLPSELVLQQYYPIRVRLGGSFSILVCTVSNRPIMTCFCSDCQGII